MSEFKELFGGEFMATQPDSNNDEWMLTDSQYHFCTIHDSLAHDDGKGEQRTAFIVKAVQGHEALIAALAEISAMCVGELAMGYKLDAQSIGELIYRATGMTQPQLQKASAK